MTPFEFGAWDGSASSFMPTQYLGTKLKIGVPVNESACVVGRPFTGGTQLNEI
jgi:lysophospholipase